MKTVIDLRKSLIKLNLIMLKYHFKYQFKVLLKYHGFSFCQTRLIVNHTHVITYN